MAPVRLTAAQAEQLGIGTPPAGPTKRRRNPPQADTPPEPTQLLSVTITPPHSGVADWTVKAKYNSGCLMLGSPTEKRARELKQHIEDHATRRHQRTARADGATVDSLTDPTEA